MEKKILLIDDDPQFRSLTNTVLKEKGMRLICAASAREAKLELATADFDLLIVDGKLPDSDGLSLIEDFRKSNSNCAILFVSASWRDSDSYHKLTKALSVNSILHKPILPAVLAQEVDKALGTWLPMPLSKSSKMAEKLAKLSAEFGGQLANNLSEISALISKSKLQNNPACIAETSRRIHMLRGTAASFGFPRITMLMAAMEDRLDELKADSPEALIKRIWEELDEHMQEAMQTARKLPALRTEDKVSPSLPGQVTQLSALLISKDRALDSLARNYAGEKEIILESCSLEQAEELAQSRHFDMIFMEADENAQLAFALSRKLRSDHALAGIPFTLIKKTKEHSLHFQELYSGFDMVLSRPITKEDIHSAFHNMVLMRNSALARVLVIDDDQQFVARVQALLALEGMRVTSFCDTNRLFELIDDLNPELLLLDINMPGVSGFDICRKLRDSKKWRELPIIFISARTDWETRVAAFECGGDDYLAKPVINAELLVKTKIWLERSRKQENDGSRDQQTKLLNHSSFLLKLRERRSSLSKEEALSVAFLKIKNMNEINKSAGPLIADLALNSMAELLNRRFPLSAIRGRWGGSTLCVALAAGKEELELAMVRFQDELMESIKSPLKTGFELEMTISKAEDLLGSW
ncbi:MAG: response regulator [Candidatus Obscuribacterales bacterium]|nr:response regulator [Candidatus Obscuribacterales bacterium]